MKLDQPAEHLVRDAVRVFDGTSHVEKVAVHLEPTFVETEYKITTYATMTGGWSHPSAEEGALERMMEYCADRLREIRATHRGASCGLASGRSLCGETSTTSDASDE